MAQRKSPSYPEWPVDRSVYSLFCDGLSTSIFYPLPLPSPISITLEPNSPPPSSLSLSPIPHPATMPSTSRRLQCNSNIERVLLYPVYVCYIVILFASLTEEATIKAKRFIIMFLKRVWRYIVCCR